MASDITTGASFNKTNMKPSPDEEISALWGQNMADNTGFLYYHPIPVCTINANHEADDAVNAYAIGTVHFMKTPRFNTLVGTLTVYKSQASTTESLKGTNSFWVNGVSAQTLDWGDSTSDVSKGTGFSVNVSALTDYQFYEISYKSDAVTVPSDTNAHDWVSLGLTVYGTTS